jgi:uncharacterized phage-like protein YoqJ
VNLKVAKDGIMFHKIKTVCFTGHRPNKLNGYNEDGIIARAVKQALRDTIRKLVAENPDTVFISGAALGVDTWAAEIVLEENGILTLAIPHVGQQKEWPVVSQYRWLMLFRAAHAVVFCDKGDYATYKMMQRNKYMVDNSDLVIAVWNGDKGSGTFNCVKYAIKQQKEILNLWATITQSILDLG